MTGWDLLVTIRRRWWVALGGVLATALLGLHVLHAPGVYHQQVDVVFMWPQASKSANTFQYGTQSLINTAGIVGTVVGDTQAGTQPVSDTATLVGEGITHGYSVRLPNSGGQWAYNFDRPMLNVETVGSTPAEVQQMTTAVVARINDELLALQRNEQVRPDLMVRTRLSPPTLNIIYSNGSRTRALAASLLLGVGLTVAVVLAVDRRLRRPAADG